MDMPSKITPTLGSIPSAFAAACRQARTDSELFERCRDVLVQRFDSDQIWFTINSGKAGSRRVGGAEGFSEALQVGYCESGETQLLILAAPAIAGTRDGRNSKGSTMKPAIAYSTRISPFQTTTRWTRPASMRNASRRTSNVVRRASADR